MTLGDGIDKFRKRSYKNYVATKGGGVPQKITSLHNSYLLIVATLRGGRSKFHKNGNVARKSLVYKRMDRMTLKTLRIFGKGCV